MSAKRITRKLGDHVWFVCEGMFEKPCRHCRNGTVSRQTFEVDHGQIQEIRIGPTYVRYTIYGEQGIYDAGEDDIYPKSVIIAKCQERRDKART